MLLTLLVALLNAALSLVGRKLLRLPGFDLAPFSIILLARMGEPVLVASLFVCLSYSAFSPKRLRVLWVTLPLTVLIGYLSFLVPSAIVLILLYHAVAAAATWLLAMFGTRYLVFMLVNLGLNILAARLYAFFS